MAKLLACIVHVLYVYAVGGVAALAAALPRYCTLRARIGNHGVLSNTMEKRPKQTIRCQEANEST